MPRLAAAAVLVGLIALAACSGGDDRIGSMDDFCAGSADISAALADLALQTDVTPDALAEIRDQLRETDAPAELRTDLDALAGVIDEVLVVLDDADLDDPAVLVAVQDRLSRLESTSGDLQASADRIFVAVDDCRAEAE